MKRIRLLLFGLFALSVCRFSAFAAAVDAVVPGLGDPLGERLGLVTLLLIVSAVIVLVIGAVSVIRRK